MKEKVYKVSRWEAGALIVSFAGMSLWQLYSAFTASGQHAEALQAFSLIMFVILLIPFIFFLWMFRKLKYDLMLNADGVCFEPLIKQIGINFVPWEEMVEASIKWEIKQRCVVVQLRESEFLNNLDMSTGHVWWFGNAFLIPCRMLSGNVKDICNDINTEIHNNLSKRDAEKRSFLKH